MLDYDDTNGLGPENYVATTIDSGKDYIAQIHMFDICDDSDVEFTLE